MPSRKTFQKEEDSEQTKRIEAAKEKQKEEIRQQQEDKEMTARIEAAKEKGMEEQEDS